jgi:minor extracellular serine protease Vpr
MRFSTVALFFVLSSLSWGQYVKGRYIVELTDSPAALEPATDSAALRQNRPASAAGSASPAARRAAAMARRSAVRSRQQGVRKRVEAQGIPVLGSVDLIGNALFVRTDDAGAAKLAATSGVKRVLPVRRFQRVLDRAIGVHQVDRVWARLGLDRAGEGMKIGIIDSGIDNNHPGLRDTSLPVPDGFPKTGQAGDVVFTNHKVIVARSYVSLLSSRDSDLSARDRVGHGTALAMIAAGNTNTGTRGVITGVAPKAYLGSYKIFGTPGQNDSATDDAILQAIEDGVADGMDVLSMSFGSIFTPRLEDDPDVAAVERASSLGVIVVAAAGNEGPDFTTLSSPAVAPSAIAVGASSNDRAYSASASVAGGDPVIAFNSSRPGSTPIRAQIVDAAQSDPTGLACGTFPAGAFTGKIVLILRGDCTFETKLIGVARAGAVGALIYTDEVRPDDVFIFGVGTATLPAQMVSYADGIAMKRAIAAAGGTAEANMTFTTTAVRVDPNRVASFSSAGPPVGFGIKPELLAVGEQFYTATQSFDARGDMYSSSGYIVASGTSFSTPFVAGIAALIKSAHPGLSVDQYRSLIINTAKPMPKFRAQVSGAGLVDAAAADRTTITASPATLSFGVGGGEIAEVRALTLTNFGSADDTFTITPEPKAGTAAPLVENSIRNVPAGAKVAVDVAFNATGLAPGTYEGYLVIEGASSGNRIRVPYWYAVKSEPASIAYIYSDDAPVSFSTNVDALIFRVLDASGVPLTDLLPEVTVVSGTATVESVELIDQDLPGAYSVALRYASTLQSSVVEVKAGGVSRRFTLP